MLFQMKDAERITRAIQDVVADCGIAPSRITVTTREIPSVGAIDVQVTIADGPSFTWHNRVHRNDFDRSLTSAVSALRAWL